MSPQDSNNQNGSTEWLDAAVELMGRAGRHGILVVQGISMKPTFRPGRKFEADFKTGRIMPGDVLLFRQEGTLVVHRFLGRVKTRSNKLCLRTRGDGIPTLDPPLFDCDVVGRAVALERDDGWRSLEGRGARFYAVLVSLHDHFWAALAVIAGRFDSWAGSRGWNISSRPTVIRFDRLLLRSVDRGLFNLFHRRAEPTDLAGEQTR